MAPLTNFFPNDSMEHVESHQVQNDQVMRFQSMTTMDAFHALDHPT
ncbi:unnamed protein product [Brugia timori]|uniref:Cytochrome oxidase subunit II n=1 Tax=Brugia timori TaxID=42155 RepID=A0A0R3QH02_9BILA|nr:unnamed protein product [Brugia timori]